MKTLQKKVLWIFIILGVLTVCSKLSGVALAAVPPASITNGTYTFLDGADISGDFGSGNTVIFSDHNISDNSNSNKSNFTPDDTAGFCDPHGNIAKGGNPSNLPTDIRYGVNISSSATLTAATIPAQVKLGYLQGTDCLGLLIKTSIQNPNALAATGLTWNGSNITNFQSQNSQQIFEPAPQEDKLYLDNSSSNGCKYDSVIVLAQAGGNSGNEYSFSGITKGSIDNTGQYKELGQNGFNEGCHVDGVKKVNIAGAKGATPSGTGLAGAAASDTSTCVFQTHNGGWDTALSWILCPVVNGLSASADGLNDFISGQLNFDVKSNLTGSVQKSWTIFRDLASALVVIVMLVMVLSQAIGGGPFDAYTVRKMLPKLAIAVILMQVSWYLCIFLIGLSNDAGHGIAGLLSVPFGGTSALELPSLLHRLNASAAAVVGVGTTTGVITAMFFSGTILLYGWPVLVMAIILVVISELVFMLTLLFRTALIILLVIAAPLAFLAFVLPGTETYWKKWRENFIKLLMFFPLVIAIIYGGRIFAWTAGNLGSAGPLDFIMVLVGFFGPYFIVPKAFKWGGGLLSGAYQQVNGAWPFAKAREVAKRELVSGEDSAMKRKMGHFAAEYVDKNHEGEFSRGRRAFSSMLAGRFIPTERAKAAMIARGNAYKTKEGELKTALATRRREKAASQTGDVGIGKQMDLETIQNAMDEISEEKAKSRPNQYRIKDLEREAKEAMRDLIATGSTLELNGMKVKDANGKDRHVWQTGLWRDLLNGSPDLYRQVKGDAPDWVPHRNPIGLPKYRGEDWDPSQPGYAQREAEFRVNMAALGKDTLEIEDEIKTNQARAAFLRTAGGNPEYVDDVQQAASLHETVTEQDAGSIARVHPTYFERIGDLAKEGRAVQEKALADRRAGLISADKYNNLIDVGQALAAPAEEFGRLVANIASNHGGRNQLGGMLGGSDTMKHLDYALQYSNLRDERDDERVIVNDTPGDKWNEGQRGKDSLQRVITYGDEIETQRGRAPQVRAPQAAQPGQQGAGRQAGTQQTNQASATPPPTGITTTPGQVIIGSTSPSPPTSAQVDLGPAAAHFETLARAAESMSEAAYHMRRASATQERATRRIQNLGPNEGELDIHRDDDQTGGGGGPTPPPQP
jgi:MFS family permease